MILLTEALEKRKEYVPQNIIDEKLESIWDILYGSVGSQLYVGILTHAKNDIYFTWYTINANERSPVQRLEVKRVDQDLQGYVCHINSKDDIRLLTLCKYIGKI